jgi:hypothetical protein
MVTVLSVLGITVLIGTAIVLILFLVFNSLGFFFGAPYAGTPTAVVHNVFSLVHIGKDDTVYDLGSGDGRVLIAAARYGARSEGWEINIPLTMLAMRRIRKSPYRRHIRVHFGNFWNTDFSKATVIFAFLLPQYMNRLEKKLLREAKSGTRVVTYLAKLPRVRPIRESPDGLTVYRF